jgi:hypothetical protein
MRNKVQFVRANKDMARVRMSFLLYAFIQVDMNVSECCIIWTATGDIQWWSQKLSIGAGRRVSTIK